MTCGQVLDIIDAGPFADCLPDDLAAAIAHTRDCASCGRAMVASNLLTGDLRARVPVASPANLEQIVMTRIARLEELPPPPQPASQVWPAWAVTAGGVAAAVAFVIELAAVRQVVPSPPEIAVGLLTASLLVYCAGLFAPLARRAGRSHPSSL